MADLTADQLSEVFKVQFTAFQAELAQTRGDLKEVSTAMRHLEIQLAKIDTQSLITKQEDLQKRISLFEKNAVTEADLNELRYKVEELVTESTGRKAQARVLKWGLATLSAVNLALLIYLNWKRI